MSRIAILETSTHFLSRMDNQANQEAARGLKQAAHVLSQLDMPKAEDIGGHVAAALKPAFSQISEEFLAQRQAIEAQRQDLLTHLINELQTEVIEPVAQRLDNSAEITRDASEAVRELKNELGGISQNLAGSVETIQRFQSQTLEELQKFANSLQQTLHEFQAETKGVLHQVATDVSSVVDKSIEGIEQSAKQTSAMLDTARNILEGTLKNINETLQDTHFTVQEELEKFRDGYQGSLKIFFDQQNEQLSGLLDQQRDGLTGVVEELRQVFQNDTQVMRDNITESMDRVLKTTRDVSNLVNTLGLEEGHQMAQLEQIARIMGDEVKHIEQSYQKMSDQLQQALVDGNERLSKYLRDADEMYSGRLTSFDQDAAKVCQGLLDTSEHFVQVADYLQATAKELSISRGSSVSQNGHREVSHV